MVEMDDMISLVVFLTAFISSIVYYSTLPSPNRVDLQSLASSISAKILTPKYLTWNVTKTRIFLNASSAQNLYPIDIRIAFPNNTAPNSVRAVYYTTGLGVGFIYANVSTHEFVMLANLTTGENIFDVFSSPTDSSPLTINTDLSTNGLNFSNTYLLGSIALTGNITSVSFNQGANLWKTDQLFINQIIYQATAMNYTLVPVRLESDFTDGVTTKTFKVYAFNPVIRVNISAGNYTWATKWSTNINKTFTTSDIALTGSNTQVFSGATNLVDLYTSPGSTTGVTFSAFNMNATVYDASDHREFNVTNFTGYSYEMYYHNGSYTNGKPYNDLRVSAGITQLTTDSISGIKASLISNLNSTSYSNLKTQLGSSKDFNIQIQNATDSTLLLNYGQLPTNTTEVVVNRRVDNLLTTDYNFQKVIVIVKTWN